ncbi:MAG: alkaline phosphatase family protein [Candidatus Limnocylindrales bacterium]
MNSHQTRRAPVIAAAAIAIIAGLGLASGPVRAETTPTSPIRHFISLLQENHTFDNYFGTFPGVDGIPPGTCMPKDPTNPALGCVEPFKLGGRPVLDLSHSRATFDGQYRGGAMDGFVAAHGGVDLAMGYYDGEDLPYYWNLAEQFVLFDRFFSSSAGGSVVNHVYWVAGQPGPRPDSIPPNGLEVETIFDRLQAAGISWKFYVQNYDPTITYRNLAGQGDRASQVIWAPLLSIPRFIDDPELASHIVDLDEYYDDLNNGTLPAVAYMVPSGASEHPPGSLVSGQRFVQTLINALIRSSAWEESAFLLSYDDWGGWYDHVAPPQIDRFGYGFRVPGMLISPYAKRGFVDNTELDFTSIIRFVEVNWGLETLGGRVAGANSFDNAFDFASGPRAPVFIGADRVVQRTADEPNRPILYLAYAASITLAVLMVLLAVIRERGIRALLRHVRTRRGPGDDAASAAGEDTA